MSSTAISTTRGLDATEGKRARKALAARKRLIRFLGDVSESNLELRQLIERRAIKPLEEELARVDPDRYDQLKKLVAKFAKRANFDGGIERQHRQALYAALSTMEARRRRRDERLVSVA